VLSPPSRGDGQGQIQDRPTVGRGIPDVPQQAAVTVSVGLAGLTDEDHRGALGQLRIDVGPGLHIAAVTALRGVDGERPDPNIRTIGLQEGNEGVAIDSPDDARPLVGRDGNGSGRRRSGGRGCRRARGRWRAGSSRRTAGHEGDEQDQERDQPLYHDVSLVDPGPAGSEDANREETMQPRWAISVWDRDTASWRHVLKTGQRELLDQFCRGVTSGGNLKVYVLSHRGIGRD